MKYQNLLNEIKMSGLKTDFILAKLNLSQDSFFKKLNGQLEFTITEAIQLRELLSNKNLSLEYLFADK